MIELIVEDYCQNCPLFEATVTRLTAYGRLTHGEGKDLHPHIERAGAA